MSRTTIYSIAAELQVSPSTVSRTFSRPELVRPEVRDRVLAAAQRLNYVPHRTARRLATGRNGMLAVLMPDITNPYFPPLLRAIQLASGAHGLEVLFIDSGIDAGEKATNETRLLSQVRDQVDGFIVASPRAHTGALREAVGQRPAVTLNRVIEGVSAAVVDDEDAIYAAGHHLHGLGHRRLAVLEGPANSWVAGRRLRTIMAMAHDLALDLERLGPYEASFDGGFSAAPALVRSGATAAMAFDDVSASGLIAGLNTMGRSSPAQCSIVGCDDVPLASMLTPQLTTLTAPIEKLGAAAVELAVHLLGGTPQEPTVVRFRSALTVRGTTGPPAPATG